MDEIFVPVFQKHARLINNHSNAERLVTSDNSSIASYILNSVEVYQEGIVQNNLLEFDAEDVEKHRYFKKPKSGKLFDQKTIHFGKYKNTIKIGDAYSIAEKLTVDCNYLGANTLQSDDIEPEHKLLLSYIDLYEIYCDTCNQGLQRLARESIKTNIAGHMYFQAKNTTWKRCLKCF